MLREWEKRGYFGEVEQIDGKRMYDDVQFERVKFVLEKVNEQRKQGIKRTEYSKIEDALLERFGGEVAVRENAKTREELLSHFMQQLENRDKQVYGALGSIQSVLEGLQDAVNVPKELPDTTKQDQLLESIYTSVQKSNEKEADLEKKYEVLTANFKKLAEVHEKLIEKLETTEDDNKKLRHENRTLKSELEKEKNRKWWQRF